ncbi:hypothetical protein D3C72_1787240 [compost metagenome]
MQTLADRDGLGGVGTGSFAGGAHRRAGDGHGIEFADLGVAAQGIAAGAIGRHTKATAGQQTIEAFLHTVVAGQAGALAAGELGLVEYQLHASGGRVAGEYRAQGAGGDGDRAGLCDGREGHGPGHQGAAQRRQHPKLARAQPGVIACSHSFVLSVIWGNSSAVAVSFP